MLNKSSQEPLGQFQPNLIGTNLIGNNAWELGIQICSNKRGGPIWVPINA